jgi:hypothetical protein
LRCYLRKHPHEIPSVSADKEQSAGFRLHLDSGIRACLDTGNPKRVMEYAGKTLRRGVRWQS